MTEPKAPNTQETTQAANAPEQAAATATTEAPSELQNALASAESFKAKYMTTLADMENLRKRHSREREEYTRYGTANIIEELLPFIDSYTLALSAARQHHPEAKTILDGFGMLLPQLTAALTQQGLKELKPQAGDTFDPNLHQSVGEVASDSIPHHAIHSLQRAGYQLHDRLLRPAMVTLSSGPAK